MDPVALQWLDNILIDYNVGQAVFVLFVLALVGVLPLRSRKVLALTLVAFGLLFALVPRQAAPIHWRFLGYVLIVLAPMLYLTSRE